MCGISGFINFSGSGEGLNTISKISAAMLHRGPDASGFYHDHHAALGHNRLSIIDLSECSNQPMADHTGRYHIVFNGEIYNYRQLRTRLHHYPFTSNGDTETILAAFIQWGPDCVKDFEGMFAFGIWDVLDKTLFLARDRLGVKPLYYHENGPAFLFASEIRALLQSGIIPAELNPVAASEFLQFQSITFPATIISNINTIEAGTWMMVSADKKIVGRYWNISQSDPSYDFNNVSQVKSTTKKLVENAVKRRLVSDVPVAAFLSGGIDSSAVVAIMSEFSSTPVNTFTVAFEEKEYDESAFAALISAKFNTRHQEIRLNAQYFMDDLLPALDAMDFPSGDGVNSFVVSKSIRQHGIKVALSGTGGDELFAGYPIFKHYTNLMRFRNWWALAAPVRKFASMILPNAGSKYQRYRQLLSTGYPGIAGFYPALRQVNSPSTISVCTSLPLDTGYPMNGYLHSEPILETLPLLSQVSFAEYMGYTQYTLLRDMDQMSMASSLEVREPFFDHDLVSYVLNIPDHIKHPHYPKQLLVEALGNLLPPEIVHRKKRGFEFPWKIWMKNELRSFCEQRLEAIGERDFIHKEQLMKKWKRFLNNHPQERWMELWLFVVLEYWLEKNNVR